MYARGSDNNTEFNTGLNSFFRGIVIDDRDPNQMQRVKIFIPELTNLDYNNEIDGDRTVEFGAPHSVGDLTPALHKHLIEILPWAEQAAGLFGERGLSHYKGKAKSQVSKATYVGKKTESKPPNSKTGGGMPRQQIANRDNSGAGSSIDNFAGKNPTAAGYMPINSGPMASGIYGVPQVGAHVWVFFDRGDINFPVYFASIPSYAESAQVFQNGGYPGNFSAYDPQGAEDTPPSEANLRSFREDGSFNREDLPPNLQPLYEDYVRYGEEYGVDPRFLASISILETGGGTSKAFREGNNAMGISNATGVNYYRNDPAARGRSIRSMARSLVGAPGTAGYYGNATTIREIGPIYAPSGALNDLRGTNSGWARNVSNIMRRDFGVKDPEELRVIDRA